MQYSLNRNFEKKIYNVFNKLKNNFDKTKVKLYFITVTDLCFFNKDFGIFSIIILFTKTVHLTEINIFSLIRALDSRIGLLYEL